MSTEWGKSLTSPLKNKIAYNISTSQYETRSEYQSVFLFRRKKYSFPDQVE